MTGPMDYAQASMKQQADIIADLTARLAAAEAALADAKESWAFWRTDAESWRAQVDAAEEARRAAEAERDLQRESALLYWQKWTEQANRADAAEAARDEQRGLRDAAEARAEEAVKVAQAVAAAYHMAFHVKVGDFDSKLYECTGELCQQVASLTASPAQEVPDA